MTLLILVTILKLIAACALFGWIALCGVGTVAIGKEGL